MLDKYRDYFDIDPEYFPQINEKVINNNPDIWKKFYPHETFVKLLKDTVSVLSRKQKVSIWVEGAYGTGKSHAVLTLKKLLEASPEDTKAYFDKYLDQLSNDLYNQFQQLKTGEQRILTVHRYGSSKIHGDDSLVFAIQESIQHALKENGMDTTEAALKDSVIQWINEPLNKDFFNSLLAGPYRPIFGGADADAVIANLNSFTGDSLIELMSKITKVAEERHLQMLQLDADHLTAWIEAVIQENTDSHRLEKELILECIADYSGSFSYDELRSVLQHIYPDLYAYLMPYKFNATLLNQYFEDYKFCKLENRITPEFYSLVEEQAVKREYNLLLPARSEKIEAVDMSGAFAYFIDAMGVEFLGYISEKSKQKKLLPKITVCRSELPSITSRNKEFLDVFAEHNVQCKSIKQIDDIKHHGAENFTLENSPYPTHLIRELEIIDHVLDLIKLDLAKGKYTKAILVSDHGASRLVVLKNQLIDGEFDAKGTHCGRVCAYTEQTGSMPMIVQAGENDEYAVVANYERFKPGRLIGVEVHGGATLEEVTVPIIELSYVPGDIEIIVQTPLVMSSIRKPPIIEFYSTTKIDDIVVNVGNTEYKANTTDGHSFSIEMSKRTRANTYTADVYAGGTMIATGLEFRVEKEGFRSNDIL